MTERTVDYRGLASGLGWLGWLAVVAFGLALYAGVASVVPAAKDFFGRTSSSAVSIDANLRERGLERFSSDLERDATRFTNRSAFFVPPAPIPPPPPPPPPRDEEEDPEPVVPREPPPPSRYGGPSIAYVWDDRVTFENDMTLTAGGEGQSGVEVLSTNLPWSVKVRWRGVEFDVQLFERTTSDFLVKPEDEPAEDQSGDL